MPHSFDNTWGIVKDSGLVSSVFALVFCNLLVKCSNVVVFTFSASIRPTITDEQEAFIHQVLEISFE